MNRPAVVSADEWRAARTALLAREKELTRQHDELATARRALPMVRMDKDYVFHGPHGPAGLADLFEDRRQLIVYHMMWRPDLDAGCPSCSLVLDNIAHLEHLHATNTTFVAVARTPWDTLAGFRDRMGWTFPMYSSHGSDFNYDFHVTSDPEASPVEYNYTSAAELERKGLTWNLSGDQPGASVFLREPDGIYHTYSAYARGSEQLINTFNLLDLTPLGRQQHVAEFPHHDRYGAEAAHCH